MAEELRWVQLINTSSSTTSETNNAITSFQNTTDEDLYIRNVEFDGSIRDASPDKTGDGYSYVVNQLSKQIAYIATQGDTNFKINTNMQFTWGKDASANTISAGSIGAQVNKSYRFAKGQLVLEPNETLYIHDNHTNSGAEVTNQSTSWIIGYHF